MENSMIEGNNEFEKNVDMGPEGTFFRIKTFLIDSKIILGAEDLVKNPDSPEFPRIEPREFEDFPDFVKALGEVSAQECFPRENVEEKEASLRVLSQLCTIALTLPDYCRGNHVLKEEMIASIFQEQKEGGKTTQETRIMLGKIKEAILYREYYNSKKREYLNLDPKVVLFNIKTFVIGGLIFSEAVKIVKNNPYYEYETVSPIDLTLEQNEELVKPLSEIVKSFNKGSGSARRLKRGILYQLCTVASEMPGPGFKRLSFLSNAIACILIEQQSKGKKIEETRELLGEIQLSVALWYREEEEKRFYSKRRQF